MLPGKINGDVRPSVSKITTSLVCACGTLAVSPVGAGGANSSSEVSSTRGAHVLSCCGCWSAGCPGFPTCALSFGLGKSTGFFCFGARSHLASS